MAATILLVDDQRDILRLLHSSLNTLGHDFEIIEAPSGEEALLEAGRRRVDLLVADYLLPGMSGVELMRKIRVRHPEIKVILISGVSDRKAREEMRNAGANAIFDKPIPLADFFDAVERSLGLVRTIFPLESEDVTAAHRSRLADLLANFRQDIDAQAVFLLSDRGLILARAGDLPDSSMEVSLISALMAIYSAGLKVSRFIHQEFADNYHIFIGGDYDIILLPVNASYALFLAGHSLANREHILETLDSMLALREEIERTLKSLGVAHPLTEAESEEVAAAPAESLPQEQPDEDIEDLLQSADKIKLDNVDAFWNQAAEKHGNVPLNPDVISYEQARRLGLIPDEDSQ
jgi:CheY-like chemotaxis protein